MHRNLPKFDDAALGELEQVYAALLLNRPDRRGVQELMNIAPDSKVKLAGIADAGLFPGRSRLIVAVLTSITTSSVCGADGGRGRVSMEQKVTY